MVFCTNGPGDPLFDLMVLLGVEDFREIEGSLVRSLHFGLDLKESGDNLKTQGLANIIDDRTVLLCDYERHGVPKDAELKDGDAAVNDSEAKLVEWPPEPTSSSGFSAFYKACYVALREAGHDHISAHEISCAKLREDGKQCYQEELFEGGSGSMWPPAPSADNALSALYNASFQELVDSGHAPVAAHQLVCMKLFVEGQVKVFPPDPVGGDAGAIVYNQSFRHSIKVGLDRGTAHVWACDAVRKAEVQPKAPPFEATSTGKIEPPTALEVLTGVYNEAYAVGHQGESIAVHHQRACEAVWNVERDGQLQPPPGESEIFTMSSIEPPPGLPWVIKRQAGIWCLFPSEPEQLLGVEVPFAQHLEPILVNWLLDTAKLATEV